MATRKRKPGAGRPAVLKLTVNSNGSEWSYRGTSVKVGIVNLSNDGGEVEMDGVRFHSMDIASWPQPGLYKFAQKKAEAISKYPPGHDPVTGLDRDGLNPEDAVMYADIVDHARISYMRDKDHSLANAMEEFLYLHRIDESKARKFYRTLVANGWVCPDHEEFQHVQAERRRQMQMELSPEAMAEWQRTFEEISSGKTAFEREVEEFEI